MSHGFWKAVATGLALSIFAVYAAYSWPVLMLCVVMLVAWIAARKWQHNFWFVVSLAVFTASMWFLHKDIMHDSLTHQIASQFNAMVGGIFDGVKSNFLTK
ncbi:hypothetical protein FJY93_03885 [Candidatus Kaiserbacteria bacterium]|nr:hypothetical protein [Candidatus Kaiserbacteria bacterium]